MERIGTHVIIAHVLATGQRHQAAEAAARSEADAHLAPPAQDRAAAPAPKDAKADGRDR